MERVATVATAVSLVVIIVTLSVVVGFKRELRGMLSAAVADIVVTSPQSGGLVSPIGLERTPLIEEIVHREEVTHLSTYTAKEGVVKSADNIVGVLLKGIDAEYDLSFFERHLTEGSLPRLGEQPRSKDVLLSESVARQMDVGVGDRIEMVFIDDRDGVLRDRFQVVGLYATGVDIVDGSIALTDQRNVDRLYDGDPGVVTGYELWLDRGADVEAVAERLNEAFVELYFEEGIDAEAFTLGAIFPMVDGWLATHNVNAVVIVVIMVVVALLNMVVALLIIVLERQRMIGELRAMGCSRQQIVRIFLYRALFIVVRGVASGALIGVVLCFVQHYGGVVPLPAEGYMLSAVPAALCWGWWALVVVLTIVVTMVVMALPAMFSARISPAETMRYE